MNAVKIVSSLAFSEYMHLIRFGLGSCKSLFHSPQSEASLHLVVYMVHFYTNLPYLLGNRVK